MIGHIGLNVPDLTAAVKYYDAIAPLVGLEKYVDHDDECGYGPANRKPGTYLFLYKAAEHGDYSRERSGLQHLAFMVRSRHDVDALHRTVEQLGSTVLSVPREFPQYSMPYYATFWLDPFGFKLEAVCHYDRD
jgi:catechol 2,3-dioxygenase-like lactoylglutathione lyase family enzyme